MPEPVARVHELSTPSLTRQAAALTVCLAIPYAAAAIGGYATSRSLGDWYGAIEKPDWTPSGQTIGAVWTVLYGLMGLSAWLSWRAAALRDGADGRAVQARGWFLCQLGLNVAWSFAFFGLRSPLAGLVVIVPLWLSVAAWIRAAGRLSLVAGWLQAPYLGWVGFAAFLNGTIWWLNREP
ncbi:MAG: TspO/MBR family protein [Chloroflexota bacterium]